MGRREQPQPEKRSRKRRGAKQNKRRVWLAVALPVVLAAAMLALGTLVPDWLLSRREMGYSDTTAQAAIADVHPYGDQYETVKQSLLTTMKVRDAYDAGEYDEETDQSRSNGIADEAGLYDAEASKWETTASGVTKMNEFLSKWADEIAAAGDFWMSGLTELVTEDLIVLPDSADPQSLLVYATDYSGASMMSGLFIDASTGAPVNMELYLVGWGGTDLDAIWNGLLTAYQEKLGLQFTEVSVDTKRTAQDGVNGVSDDDFLSYSSYSAVSADQSLRLDVQMGELIGFGTDKESVYLRTFLVEAAMTPGS